jgi:hypothetical protein
MRTIIRLPLSVCVHCVLCVCACVYCVYVLCVSVCFIN